MAIAAGLGSYLFIGLFALLNVSMNQFAKNIAVNLAHQQARVAVLHMEQDIHSAVSLPQLVDANRQPIATTGPAAGISFQLFAAGPFKIAATAPSGQANISINCGAFVPQAGQRFCIPPYQIELDITAVSGSNAGVRTLTLAANLPRTVMVTMNIGGVSQAVDVTGFITDRVAYVVANGELHYYGRGSAQTYSVMANAIANATPFSTPTTLAGAPNYRFVATINLMTSDSSSNNRGFKATNMFLNSMAPCRTRLCVPNETRTARQRLGCHYRPDFSRRDHGVRGRGDELHRHGEPKCTEKRAAPKWHRDRRWRSGYTFAMWRAQCEPAPTQNFSTNELSSLPLPTAAYFPQVQNFRITTAKNRSYTLSNYNIQAVDSTWQPLAASQRPSPSYGMNMATQSYFYLATVDVTLPSTFGPPVQVNMRRIFEKDIQSPWSYAIFYLDPLEIQPGVAFKITGSVQTNASLYTGHSSLNFQGAVTYANDWIIGFMPGDSSHNGETPQRLPTRPACRPRKGRLSNPSGSIRRRFSARRTRIRITTAITS